MKHNHSNLYDSISKIRMFIICIFILLIVKDLDAQNDVIWNDIWFNSLAPWLPGSKMPARDTAGGLTYENYYPFSYNQLKDPICFPIALADTYTAVSLLQKRNSCSKVDVHNMRFSPWFIFYMANNGSCKAGLNVKNAIQALKDFGVCRNNLYKTSCPNMQPPSNAAINDALQHKVTAKMIFGPDTISKSDKLIDHLILAGPAVVCFAAKAPICEQIQQGKFWTPKPLNSPKDPGHAMSVIGIKNGYFILQNSSGTSCGVHGLIQISFANFNQYARYGISLSDEKSKSLAWRDTVVYSKFHGKLKLLLTANTPTYFDRNSRLYVNSIGSTETFSLELPVQTGNCAYLLAYTPGTGQIESLWSLERTPVDSNYFFVPHNGKLNSPEKYFVLLHSIHPIRDFEERVALLRRLIRKENNIIKQLEIAFGSYLINKSCLLYEPVGMQFSLKCPKGIGQAAPILLHLRQY